MSSGKPFSAMILLNCDRYVRSVLTSSMVTSKMRHVAPTFLSANSSEAPSLSALTCARAIAVAPVIFSSPQTMSILPGSLTSPCAACRSLAS